MAIEIQSYYPERILTNEEIASWGVKSNDKLLTAQSIGEKLGIKQRFIAGEGESVLQMAIKALESSQTPDISPDMVFFSTSYPDGVNNAAELIKHFKFQSDGFLNIHAACSGFGLALWYLHQHKDSFREAHTLIATGEKYSPTLVDLKSDQTDPSLSQAIFSDGSTVTKFTVGEDIEILNAVNYTFPKEVSTCLRMPINYDLVRHPAQVVKVPPSENGYFWMDGPKVFEVVRNTLPGLIERTIAGVGLKLEQISLVIPHQASKPVLDVLAKRLPSLDFYRDLEDGNWSSASSPKAMGKVLDEGAIRKGDKVVLAGFGAGLFASIAVVQFN